MAVRRCVLMADLDTAFQQPSVNGLRHYSDIYLHVDKMEDYTVEIKEGTLRLYRLYGEGALPDANSVQIFDGKQFVRCDQSRIAFQDALKVVANHYDFDPKKVKHVLDTIKNFK